MILSIGEILVDRLIDYSNEKKIIDDHIGGAPFNAAYYALKHNNNVGFVGAIGNDSEGQYLYNSLKNYHFRYISTQILSKKTTIAIVSINEDGERDFKFLRDNTADYQIIFDYIPENILKEATIINLGSLMMSKKYGLKLARKILKFSKSNGKTLTFDVNFRSDIFNDADEAKKIYREFINEADILKMSLDELYLFSNKKDFKESIDKIYCKNQVLLITLGEKGCFYKYNDLEIYVDSIKVKPIDTTGAGDAFFGTFLGLIDKDMDFSNKQKISAILRTANYEGAMATLFKGAIK